MAKKRNPITRARSKVQALSPVPHYSSRIVLAVLLIVSISVVGTLGYSMIEGWPPLDAFYMTIITLTTVGFGETHTRSPLVRLFTIALILSSMGAAGYAISTIASFLIEGHLNDMIEVRRMNRQISNLKNHIILCGGGRTGRHIVGELYKTHTPFVVIEMSDATLNDLQDIGDIAYLKADATDDDTLLEAGIERARGLIAALGDDKDNVFIVLSARALNPNLHIIARLNEEENEEKLRKAGANQIVSPNAIGGMRMASIMASMMIRPHVVAFLDEMMRVTGQTFRFEEVSLHNAPQLCNMTLAQADIGRKTGLLVVAIKSSGGNLQFNPGGRTVLHRGDTLIVLGTRQQITDLDNVLSGYATDSNLANVFQKSDREQ